LQKCERSRQGSPRNEYRADPIVDQSVRYRNRSVSSSIRNGRFSCAYLRRALPIFIRPQELAAWTHPLIDPRFRLANVPVECCRRLRLQLRGARAHQAHAPKRQRGGPPH
jgi:hypothetical protein